jgi:predicted RNA methylase
MGSCGGYHNLADIIDKSPEVSIISSKQIGVHMVNNPILRELADNIRSGEDVYWQKLWDRVDARLKGSIPEIYDKWLDYIPPHKNLGAIFIRSYTKLTEDQ